MQRFIISIALATALITGIVPMGFCDTNQDWAQLSKYATANGSLSKVNNGSKLVVFFGDSITEGWAIDKAFPGKHFINRGISGQTTPQMLVRFRQDVLELHPDAVVILAGTNDLAHNTGVESLEQIEGYFTSMCELAHANNIKVVLSSILPVKDYPWRPGLEPTMKIVELNKWLKKYADNHQLVYLDYFSAMSDDKFGMRKELSGDGVHPNEAGYAVMAPLAETAVAKALK